VIIYLLLNTYKNRVLNFFALCFSSFHPPPSTLSLVGLDPVPEEGHPGVDAGDVVGTAHAPGDEADDSPAAGEGLAHQR
jgi:hypothetical protein